MQDNGQPQYPVQPDFETQYTPQPATQQPEATPKKGLAVTSMILGIVGFIIALAWFLSIPTSIVAIVLGIVYLVKTKALKGGKGMAITGIILGCIGLILALFLSLITFIALPALQTGQRDTVRKNDLSLLSSQISLYQSDNRGALPEVSYIDTNDLGEVVEVAASGTPTETVAVYEIGVDCEDTPSEGSYNLKIKLESGSDYCVNN